METSAPLYTYENILLLALRDKEGTLFFDVHFPQALAGAILADLRLKNKIAIEYSGKKKFVKLIEHKSTGDQLLDECIEKIAASKRRARVENWVQRFANISKLKHKAARGLCHKGVLKMEESKILLLFTRKVYPEIDPRPEERLLERLKKAIFSAQKEVDPETVILIAISQSTGILRHVIEKDKLRENKKRIKEIISGNLIGKATKDAVEAMQAAVMVATIIPVAVAVSS
ncbi:MAG: GPP34 family phosphoprotein [Bacteroidales bacterium]